MDINISIDSPQKQFDDHLNIDGNNRILFSGKFGTGKSHFLKEYFVKNENKFCRFWISPVDYVVGANRDIFEWIKIDIAKILLENYYCDDDKKLTDNVLIQTFVYNNIGSIFVRLLSQISNQLLKGSTGIDSLDAFKDTIEQFQKFKQKSIEDDTTNFQNLAEYINDATFLKGSIYEDDTITSILRKSIELLKYQTGNECVLVIDDLDRLDPEHIFRILNILSCHNNHFESNKFGFDKVIIVCDIDNIKHLFTYKYGPDSDFDGYIEKYFTYRPFHYSISHAITSYCDENHFAKNIDKDNLVVLSMFLKLFVENGLLKIRNLKKIHGLKNDTVFPSRTYTTYAADEISYDSIVGTTEITIDYNKFDFLKVINILSVAFGGKDNLLKAFKKLPNVPINMKYFESIVKSIGIISHIANYPTAGLNTFFTIRKYQNQRTVDLMYPHINFLFLNKKIPLKWSINMKYRGGHYFELQHEYVLWNEFNTDNRINEIHLSHILDVIPHIINFSDSIS